ncbi:hypothetical protein WN51_12115 [Melipona quadrifasciata]|uniref:Uncharacterized protein n=1 Tax=Melipona quadrifasciata TaxID=166423 RepID=A0A0N0BHL6_9HYME|nr:hypothetical protein WN51_12115 [Melipona quadrifasciata]
MNLRNYTKDANYRRPSGINLGLEKTQLYLLRGLLIETNLIKFDICTCKIL